MPFDSQTLSETEARNNELIDRYIGEYARTGKPIDVNFRELVPDIKGYERYTHLIHTYPAKLLVQIPFFFLNNTRLSKRGDRVLDPFCGSGTVLLESLLAGRAGLGADANPLARVISKAKVTRVAVAEIQQELDRVIGRARRSRLQRTPDVVNRDYWFPRRTSFLLTRIEHSIAEIRNENLRVFMLVAFSNCVKKLSFADPNVSVPVKLNPRRYGRNSKKYKRVKRLIAERESCDAIEKFRLQVLVNAARTASLPVTSSPSSASVIAKDASHLTEALGADELLPDNSISLIITSPPYAGAQKYIRASSLSLGWTGLAATKDLPELDRLIIGRESFRKDEIRLKSTGIAEADRLIDAIAKEKVERAAVVWAYLTEMQAALKEMVRVLKPGGHLILVIGNNRICGREFDAQKYLCEYVNALGLGTQFRLIDDIRSYGLMTKRNRTADIISREWVLVFRKPAHSAN